MKAIGDDLKRSAVGVDKAAERALILFQSNAHQVCVSCVPSLTSVQIKNSIDEYTALKEQAAQYLEKKLRPSFNKQYTVLVNIVETYFSNARKVLQLSFREHEICLQALQNKFKTTGLNAKSIIYKKDEGQQAQL